MYFKRIFKMYQEKVQEIKISLIRSVVTFIAQPKPIANYTRCNRYELGCEDQVPCDYLKSKFVNRKLNKEPVNEGAVNDKRVNDGTLNEEPVNEEQVNEEPMNEEPVNEESVNEEPVNEKCEVKKDKVVEESKSDKSHENVQIDEPVVENIFMKNELSSNENKIPANDELITDHEDEILCNKNEITFNEINVQKNEIDHHKNKIIDQKNQNIENLGKIDKNISQAEIDENARKKRVIEKFLQEIFGEEEKIENYKVLDKDRGVVDNDNKIYNKDHEIVCNDHENTKSLNKNYEDVDLKPQTPETILRNSIDPVINLERRIIKFESGIEIVENTENCKVKNDESRMKLHSKMNNYTHFKDYLQDNSSRTNTMNDLIVKSGYFLINNDDSSTKNCNPNIDNETFKSGNGHSLTLNDDHWREDEDLNKMNTINETIDEIENCHEKINQLIKNEDSKVDGLKNKIEKNQFNNEQESIKIYLNNDSKINNKQKSSQAFSSDIKLKEIEMGTISEACDKNNNSELNLLNDKTINENQIKEI
ncbi:hypothetical protein DMUE_3680, partial [Dictyocoela muelleri]